MNLKQFATRNRIRVEWDYGNDEVNNHWEELDEWHQKAHPWTATIKHGRRRMTISYWTGAAIGEPDAEDVLDSLRSEAQDIASGSTFEQWASELGYDPDSRKAEKVFEAVQAEYRKLLKLLGPELTDELLNCESC